MANKRKNIRNAKAERARRKRRQRRKKRILFLMAEILILCILGAVAFVMAKYDKFQVVKFEDGDIKVNEGVKEEGYTTVALFGGDSRDGALEAGTHTDCIIIASINNETKEIRMASIYRDTVTESVKGELKKANNAYFAGGPKDAINMLNKNLDLSIEDYVTVDFKALVDTIDLLGGIAIDIQPEEVQYMNKFLDETAQVAGTKANHISESGLQHLDGAQAVTYARIRSTAGGDYKRTERQRLVIQKIFEKVKTTDLGTINKIIDTVFPQVSTSFELTELVSLASGVTKYQLGESTGYPFEKTAENVDGLGSVVIPLGMVENVSELHAFLYPDEEYAGPSETVRRIAGEIEERTGYTRADYKDPNADAQQTDTQKTEGTE